MFYLLTALDKLPRFALIFCVSIMAGISKNNNKCLIATNAWIFFNLKTEPDSFDKP
jgi:hypothetical protein